MTGTPEEIEGEAEMSDYARYCQRCVWETHPLMLTTYTLVGPCDRCGRAEPGEIAEGVAFLSGDESGYMTGHTLHVNGGTVML